MIILFHNRLRRSGRFGFSLVELLVVVGVLALLMGLLLSLVSVVQDRARREQTRAQLAAYTLAYEAYRADRGYLPTMGAEGAEFRLSGNNAVFIETLTGYTLEGGPSRHPNAVKANPRRERYYTFSPNEFAAANRPFAGQLVDAFGNPNIVAVIDRTGSGVLRADDFAGLAREDRPESLLGRVVFYVANPEQNPEWEQILPWAP